MVVPPWDSKELSPAYDLDRVFDLNNGGPGDEFADGAR